jgi:hypothetical protein
MISDHQIQKKMTNIPNTIFIPKIPQMGVSLTMNVIFGWIFQDKEVIHEKLQQLSKVARLNQRDRIELEKMFNDKAYYDIAELLSSEIGQLTIKMSQISNNSECLLIGVEPQEATRKGDGWWYRTTSYTVDSLKFEGIDNQLRQILPSEEPQLVVSGSILP